MKDEIDDSAEKPPLVEEMGPLEGHELVKSPRLLPPVEKNEEQASHE